MNQAVSAMRRAGSQAQSAGRNMGQGFLNGLNSMSGSIIGRARSIANQAASAMRSALKIHSPSRVTAKIGQYTGQGLEQGMLAERDAITRASRRLADSAIPNMPGMDLRSSRGALQGSTDRPGRPLEIKLSLGGKEYRAFAKDIHRVNQDELRLEANY